MPLLSRLAIAAICWCMVPLAWAASVDCAKQSTPIASLICNSIKVKALDEKLSGLYEAAVLYQQGAKKQEVIDDQSQWYPQWRDACTDISCLIDTYEIRIEALQDLVPPASPDPLKCPQCGRWTISTSNVAALSSEWMLIDRNSVRLKGCGEFFYDKADIQTTRRSDARNQYTFQAQFSGRTSPNAASVCGGDDQELWDPRKWQLTMTIGGHFQEIGYADVVLTQADTAAPVLTFRAWGNEDPCSDGSAFGSIECSVIHNGELRHALWMAMDRVQSRLTERQRLAAQRKFSLYTYLERTSRYCTQREHGRGGGSWPSAWMLMCEGEQLSDKLKQFQNLEACAKADAKLAKCELPSNAVDTSGSRSAD